MPRHNSKRIDPSKYRQVFKPNWVVSSLKDEPIDVWEALSEDLLRSKEHRPEGKGWLQIEELAVKRGSTINSARKFVMQCGSKLERFRGHLADNGKLKQKVWYRPKA